MNSLLLRISTTIDGWNEAVGKAASWLSLFLVVVVCVDVFLGNVFRYSNAGLFELQWHFFALIFL
ncbi:MAG: C4-dicarboxylate ABC transporter permease, partial [Bacteroidota bacterium]